MEIKRLWVAEKSLQDTMDVRGRQEIFAPGHQCDLLFGIVRHDSKVIGSGNIPTGKNDVTHAFWMDGNGALAKVAECELATSLSSSL